MSADTVVEKREFTFTWRIENFHMCPLENGESLVSPTFFVKSFFNTKWNLILYPKGDVKDNEGFVSCYLYRKKANESPEVIEITFKLCVNSVTNEAKFNFDEGMRMGFTYMQQGLLKECQDNGFVIDCHMIFCIDQNTCFAEGDNDELMLYLLHNFLKLDSVAPDVSTKIYVEIKKKLQGLKRKLLPSPNQCFARSRVLVERRCITCPIKELIHQDGDHKQCIPVNSFSNAPSFLITLRMSEKDGVCYLETEIGLLEKLKSKGLLECEIQIIDSGRKIYNIAASNRIFRKVPGNDVWKFGHEFTNINLMKNEDAILCFRLAFADGRIFSDIELTADEYCHSLPVEKTPPNDILKNMFRLYSENKFCDVTLKTKDKPFQAHKCVICAMSPVFDAMFQSGTKENATNIVHIEDLDPDTAKQMIDYMYTETIEQLEFGKAKKLFYASDKYQIDSLKMKCKNYLKSNLCVENFYDVLSLADVHHDEDLMRLATCFLSIHKEEILRSPNWAIFESEKTTLAMETLKIACLM